VKTRLLKAFVCVFLGVGSVMGVPMRPEEIAELMSNMNQPKIAVTLPEDDDRDDPLRELLKRSLKLD
jgi:hypothetical protein